MPHIFDAHLHIVQPGFPLIASQGFLPAPFTVEDYGSATQGLEIVGGAVVSGSFQGFDQDYLLDALERLGPGFVGVTQLPASAPDALIQGLDARGVRGVRVNLRRGGSETREHLDRLARRVHEQAGWHLELYVDARHLASIEGVLSRLPALSIDHLGLSADGLPALLRLVERGARVKATGFGRLDFPAERALGAIHSANPEALMFGTDLPCTRAPRPFQPQDLDLVIQTLGEGAAPEVLSENARRFYRLTDARPCAPSGSAPAAPPGSRSGTAVWPSEAAGQATVRR